MSLHEAPLASQPHARAGMLTLCVLLGLPALAPAAQNPKRPALGAPRVVGQADSASNQPKYKPGEVLVRFRKGVSKESVEALHKKIGAQVIRTYRTIDGLQLVRIPAGMAVEAAIGSYRKNPEVLYAEPNYIVKAVAIPNDPLFPDMWGLNNTGQNGGVLDADIDAPEAWDLSTGSSSVMVVDIDTGIDYNHQDLAANVWNNPGDCDNNGIDDDADGWIDDCHGINPVYGNGDPFDDNGHGTHTAGTIGAVGNNSVGVVGVNWNVTLAACKFLDSGGSGSTDGAIACLDWVALMYDRGLNVVATNNSWGGGGFSQALLDAINANGARGILFFAAAGNATNDNDLYPFYPAAYFSPYLVAVAATDRYDGLAYFSNYGRRRVHIGAPGHEILSTTPGNTYSVFSGTSMATPHVTGLAALLKAQDPNRDWRATRNLILAGGDNNANLANTVTQKRLNAHGSMTCSNSTVFSRLIPVPNTIGGGAGSPIDLAALNINCAAPNGDVPVTVDPGGQTVTLLDDGLGIDQATGDGIYSGQWTPGAPGTYTLTFPDGDVVTVQVLQNYLVTPTPFNWRTITGTNLFFGDDSSALITPGFPIPFAGGSFNDVWVGSNGNISFTSPVYSYFNDPLPTLQFETFVAPFWDDLYAFGFGADNNVFWEVIGAAPNREVVVEWRNIGHCCLGDPAVTVTFQVVFFENSSNILFNYQDVFFGDGYSWADQGADATVGVQIGSTVGTQWSFNTPSLSDNFSLLWTISQLSLVPSSLDFGDVLVGNQSSPQTITLTNNAALPVNILAVQVSGDFAQTNDCVSPIVPGGTCAFTVTFTPTVLGRRDGQLSVSHDALGSPSVAFLTGRGVSSGGALPSPPSLSFGDQQLGTTSPAQPVTLTNTGTGPLGILNISTTEEFVLDPPHDCPASLAIGASCTINVKFAPLRLGPRSGELRIEHDGAGSPAIVALIGNSIPPPNGSYVYTNNDLYYSPNTVSAFLVAPDGVPLEIPGSPFLTGGTGNGGGFFATNRVGISAVGNFLYVTNAGSGDVSGFAIDPANGNLAPVPGSPFYAGGPSWLGISVVATSDGQFVIAGNATNYQLHVFAKAGDGSLSPIPGSPFPIEDWPNGIRVSPDGRFLAVALSNLDVVSMYAIGSDGTLSPVPGSPFPAAGAGVATGVDIDCGTRYVFTGEATYPGTVVDVFSIGSDGALTPIPGSPFAPPGAGDNSNVPLLSPDDRTLFVSNQGYPGQPNTNSVTVFTVAADGSLTMVAGSPFPVGGTAYFTSGMATDQAGRFLFTASFDNWVGAFSVGADGVLTSVPGSPFSTGQPYGLLSLTVFPPKGCPVTLSPGRLDFGSQRVTVPSDPQTVTLVNRSANAVNNVVIGATADFSQVNDCPSTIQPGVPCNINVTFTPTVRGLREGDLTISSDALGSPHQAHLQGTGIAPEVSLTPTSLAFGDQQVGTVSPTQPVILENTGDIALNISSIVASGDFASLNTCPAVLEPSPPQGDDIFCLISVDFRPTAAGALAGTVTLTTDAPGSPHLVTLSGSGVGPVANLSATSLAFPDTTLGSSSAPLSVTVTNNGNVALAISNVGTTNGYSVANGCGSSVAPGVTCSLDVTFTPLAAGAINGLLVMVDNAVGSPRVVSLSGNGVGPVAGLAPASLSFASQVVSTTSAAQTATLTNSGNRALSISGIVGTSEFSASHNCPSSLAPGGSCNVQVAFTPAASGARSAAILVNDNAYGSPHTVVVNGTGEDFSVGAPPGGSLSANIRAGDTATFSLSLSATSGFNGNVTLSCSGAPRLATCTVSPTSVRLSGGGSASATVTVKTTARAMTTPVTEPRAAPPGPVPNWYGAGLGRFVAWPWLLGLLMLAMLAALARNAERRTRFALAALMLFVLVWAACGGGAMNQQVQTGTPPGTYTLTVTATYTSNAGSSSHSVPITVTVN